MRERDDKREREREKKFLFCVVPSLFFNGCFFYMIRFVSVLVSSISYIGPFLASFYRDFSFILSVARCSGRFVVFG